MDISFLSDRFQMARIDTATVKTEMVNRKPCWNWPHIELISEAMSQCWPPDTIGVPNWEIPVTIRRNITEPLPANRCLLDFRLKAFKNWFWFRPFNHTLIIALTQNTINIGKYLMEVLASYEVEEAN